MAGSTGAVRTVEGCIEISERRDLAQHPELWGLLGYIDDIVAFAPDEVSAWEMVNAIFKTANRLGMSFSRAKFLPPAPRNKAIGFIFDLPQQTVHIPEDKLVKARGYILTIINAPLAPAKKTESLLGLLQWMAPIIYPSKVMLRTLTAELTQCNHDERTHYHLSNEARGHLRWWLQWSEQLNTCSFDTVLGIFPTDDVFIYTDASDWGIGAWLLPRRRFFNISFTRMPRRFKDLATTHISVREAVAFAVAVCTWEEHISHRFVRCFLDNKPVVQALIKLWSSNERIMKQLRTVALAAVRTQCRFMYHWIPTLRNPVADALSWNLPQEFKAAIGERVAYRDSVPFDLLEL